MRAGVTITITHESRNGAVGSDTDAVHLCPILLVNTEYCRNLATVLK